MRTGSAWRTVFFAAAFPCLAAAGCGVVPADAERRSAEIIVMGGVPLEIVLFGRGGDQFRADVEAVRKEAARLEKIFNAYDRFSALSRLNARPVNARMEVAPELAEVLRLSRRIWRLTDGRFDPTVGPLIALWKKAGVAHTLPTPAEIRAARERTGMDKLRVEGLLVMRTADVAVDLGGVAKGYIVDRLVDILRRRGAEAGIVNAGGDLRVFGKRRGGFLVGIRDPRDPLGLIKKKTVHRGAVVTSGSYERFVVIEGKRYSHIIDPVTGRPVSNDLASVTVYAPDAATADALATGIFVLGFEKGRRLLERLEHVGGFLVKRDGTTWEKDVPSYEVQYATGAVAAVFFVLVAAWHGAFRMPRRKRT